MRRPARRQHDKSRLVDVWCRRVWRVWGLVAGNIMKWPSRLPGCLLTWFLLLFLIWSLLVTCFGMWYAVLAAAGLTPPLPGRAMLPGRDSLAHQLRTPDGCKTTGFSFFAKIIFHAVAKVFAFFSQDNRL